MKTKNMLLMSAAVALTLSTVILPVAGIHADDVEDLEITYNLTSEDTEETEKAVSETEGEKTTPEGETKDAASDETEVVDEVTETSVQDVAKVTSVVVKTAEDLVKALSSETEYTKVTLGADVSLVDQITVDKTVELELGEYTLNMSKRMIVEGDLTISGEGKILSSDYLFNVYGKLTINGGELVANGAGRYGAYVLEGGSATINGGSVTADYAAFAGNNTTGNMNFYVNGGTLKSLRYPAIYMPGQVYLVITGGTIDGGVVARMGQITVSGGNIVNSLASAEMFDGDMYQSGMPQTLDAFAIVGGGNYKSADVHGNTLNMTVTGGTFSSKDGKAIARYDLGRLAQEVNAEISGGKFSSKPENVKLGYVAYETANGYEVTKIRVKTDDKAAEASDTKSENAAVLTAQAEKVAEALVEKFESLTDGAEITVTIDGDTMVFVAEDAAAAKNAILHGDVVVAVTAPVAATGVSEAETAKVAAVLTDGVEVVGTYEIDVVLTDGTTAFGAVTELSDAVEITLDVNALPAVAEGYERHFQVVRYHGDKAEGLAVEYDAEAGKISFKSDKFSNFTVAYVDTKKAVAPVDDGSSDGGSTSGNSEDTAKGASTEVAGTPNTGALAAAVHDGAEAAVIVTTAMSAAILAAGVAVARRNMRG